MICFLLSPARINPGIAGPDETKNRARRGVLRLGSGPLSQRRVLKRRLQSVKVIWRTLRLSARVQQAQSAFDRRVQWSFQSSPGSARGRRPRFPEMRANARLRFLTQLLDLRVFGSGQIWPA